MCSFGHDFQECYTRVLKGHINLSSAIFPNGVKGKGFLSVSWNEDVFPVIFEKRQAYYTERHATFSPGFQYELNLWLHNPTINFLVKSKEKCSMSAIMFLSSNIIGKTLIMAISMKIYMYIGSQMNFHSIRCIMKRVVCFISPSLWRGDIKHTTSFIIHCMEWTFIWDSFYHMN